MKRRINKWWWICMLCPLLMACSDDDDWSGSTSAETIKAKVAIVMPESEQMRWERVVDWALSSVHSAQSGLSKQLKIEVEWINEDDDSWVSYVEDVVADDDYKAIIGPQASTNAQKVAQLCKKKEKTLILPIATSSELQRLYAGCDYVWNLTESDITQCQLLMTQALLAERTEVSLLTSDDNYGQSFEDWFGFLATQLGLTVGDIVVYQSETEIRELVRSLYKQSNKSNKALIFAPSTNEYALVLDDELYQLKSAETGTFEFPMLLCSDVVNATAVLSEAKYDKYEGLAPSAAPESGFRTAYLAKYGEEPISGEAHLFDAVLLFAYGLTYQAVQEQTTSLNESLTEVVDGRTTWTGSWLKDDLQAAFTRIQQGIAIDLSGVTGDWTFDERTHASVLNTTYCHWVYMNGVLSIVEFLSTDGGVHTTSTTQAWEWQSSQSMTFDESQADFDYPELEDRWAVVVAGSDEWIYYRHQADALAMYQLLKRHGYDDDHIILIMEDNLAYNPNNLYQGVVKVTEDGENLYVDVDVDYKLSELSPSDLKPIMLGQASDEFPQVISSKSNDNVMFFWCGHGDSNLLVWGSNDYMTSSEIRDILDEMNEEDKYRKLFFALDACYSGSFGEACEGLPGVVVLTSANASESSKADQKDEEMGIWLSNAFTRSFQETIDESSDILLSNLYYTVARQTFGSHAMMYNVENYGNVFKNSMGEFLDEE